VPATAVSPLLPSGFDPHADVDLNGGKAGQVASIAPARTG
jgi:hypothetical protein